MSTVLLQTGRSIRASVCYDPHTGAPYVYARNVNDITVRVPVAPGESVEWVEVPNGNPSGATGYTLAA